ncbi:MULTISPECIES: SP_1767 family glycosyltransferase [Bacteroides]|uniref:SP_1767 family glycosyltransferase n=1 Tax=Bacteroides TaxID=816 RepID=UPI0004699FCB|nr:SP_1767 family glycosyltransferase [Bacteroides acidifaciens]MCR1996567.1 SP_1767 family glycosyltransferase [Bacteroides acidifaciens]
MNMLFRIKRRLHWEWHKWTDQIYRRIVTPPFVMSYQDCVAYILSHRASITRFGDGELGVIYGRTLGFQERNEKLSTKLRQVLESDVENLLICLPDTFQNLERYNQVEQDFWNAHHYFNRRRWLKSLKSGKCYGNTFLSRFYSMEFDKALSAHRITLLKQLWNNRDIIFVEGRDTKMGVGNDLFDNAQSIRRVLCPSKDAFEKYDDIITKVLEISHNENNLFILALGPTATAMAADLHKAGLQALDMGHMDIEYEWYRMGVTQKVPVTGKFSNEAAILGLAESTVVGELKDDIYQKQIIIDLSK